MYYPINNFSNCNIFSNSFLQDLESYNLLNDSNSDLHIVYDGDSISSSNLIDFKINDMLSLIPETNLSLTKDVWFPAIAYYDILNPSLTSKYKPVFDKTINYNPILGIDSMIVFQPKFKNWTMTINGETQKNMVCNWHINSILSNVEARYGIMYWYKYTDYGRQQNFNYADLSNHTKFTLDFNITYGPSNALKTISANSVLEKYDNTYIKLPETYRAKIESGSDVNSDSNPISFGPSWPLLAISDINTNNWQSQCKIIKDSIFSRNNTNLDIYISNGDCFSYYESYADRLRSMAASMPTKTYLSHGLFNIYREIYHRLSISRPKKFNKSLSVKQARLLQKLSYFLSSGPLMDRTTVDLLLDDSIQQSVRDYIDSDTSSVASEITGLKNILQTIYSKFTNLSTYQYKQTQNLNYILTKKDLFKCLTPKYGCGLWIDNPTTIQYKYPLKNGPHLLSTQNYTSWCKPNSIVDSSNEIFFNNSAISVGNLLYQTSISTTGSVVRFATNFTSNNTIVDVPLADISLHQTKLDKLFLSSGIYQPWTGYETEFNLSDVLGTTDDATYFWEQIGGPNCLRFNDYNKDKSSRGSFLNIRRFFTSTFDSPSVYTRQSGTYLIKCTRNSKGSTDSDIVILTNDPTGIPTISIPTKIGNSLYPTIISSIPKTIAFNKQGMIGMISSENYVDTDDINVSEDFDEYGIAKFKDYKINLNEGYRIPVLQTGGYFSLNINPSGLYTFLSSISLQNMRDEKYEYCQCPSLYEEKILRKPRKGISLPVLGSSDFTRDIDAQYKFIYHNRNGKMLDAPPVVINVPTASTAYSPKILPYGGYGKDIVDSIGINMPGHPKPLSGLIPPVTGSLANALPILTERNNFEMSADVNKKLICHLREIQPTGTKHYVNMSRGHFHPISGWITDTKYIGKSNVWRNKPYLRSSYEFVGAGFADISPKNTFDNNLYIYSSDINLLPIIYENIDQDDKYGFYNINSDPKLEPDFIIEDQGYDDFIDSGSCGSNKTIYRLPDSINNRTIKSLDVKINLMNHFNPKNLVIWLEVKNTDSPISGIVSNDPTNLYIDSTRYQNHSTSMSGYLNNLQISNSGIDNLKIYLLNQQHISNYSLDFTINFSDFADKYVLANRSLYGNNNISCNYLNNNSLITSTLSSVSGYNDIELDKFTKAIKFNQINLINNNLSKFKNIPLKNTTITLKIANIEPLEHTYSVLDNLNNHNNLLGLNTTERHRVSGQLRDSICKWSVVVHTSSTTRSSTQGIDAYIDYNGSISNIIPTGEYLNSQTNKFDPNIGYAGNSNYLPTNISGYDFIGDFSDKNFLIPLVNINAPYNYLANISECFYNDPNIPRLISNFPPQFPSLLGYLVMGVGAASLAGFGLAGAMAGLALIGQALSQGGRNDPIINFLIDSRNYNQTAVSNAQFYKPVYSSENYGYGDRAIVAVSQDGALWYNVEVPIFRYSNTPLVAKNIYKYIKLNNNAPNILSKFNFKVLTDQKDLDLAYCIGTISEDIESDDYQPDNFYLSLKTNDIVYLDNQNSDRDNGYYCVNLVPNTDRSSTIDSWYKIPSRNSVHFLSYNNVGSGLFNSINSSGTIKNNIIIDGIRAYNFFDIGETATLSEPLGASVSITDKSIIATRTGQKTILTLSSGLKLKADAQIFKADSAANVIFLYKDSVSSVAGDTVPINQWASDSKKSFDSKSKDTEIRLSCIGEGSIGWGTDSIFPETVSWLKPQEQNNNNADINNHNNDIININNLAIITGEVVQYITAGPTKFSLDGTISDRDIKDRIKASLYSFDNIGLSFNDISSISNSDNIIINTILKRGYQTSYPDQKNKIFIDLKSDEFINIPESGSIVLDQDNLYYKSIKFLDSDITTIKNRLTDLLSVDNDFNPGSISDIYTINSIDNCQKYYNSLSDDPEQCYQANRSTVLVCNKLKAEKRLKELYKEKYDLDMALMLNSSGIQMPHISGSIVNSLPTGITIKYTENTNLYWIHIDPNQKCSINDELTVKVLTKTNVYAVPVTDTFVPSNMITPNYDEASNFVSGVNVTTKWNGYETEYTIPDSIVQREKNNIATKYSSLDWTEDDEIFVYGQAPVQEDRTNSKKVMICPNTSRDYIIQLKETYIRPPCRYTGPISGVIDFSQNDLKLKFRNLPRKLKSVDSEMYQRYTYDTRGNLVKDTSFFANVGQIANNFVCWQCFNTSGIYVTGIPPYFIAANEMRYRSFFGSIDGIEHKNTFVSDSKEDWEWIPYEYYQPTGVI